MLVQTEGLVSHTRGVNDVCVEAGIYFWLPGFIRIEVWIRSRFEFGRERIALNLIQLLLLQRSSVQISDFRVKSGHEYTERVLRYESDFENANVSVST